MFGKIKGFVKWVLWLTAAVMALIGYFEKNPPPPVPVAPISGPIIPGK